MNFYVHFIYFSYFRPDKIRLIYPSHIILIDQIGNIGLAHMAGESMIKKNVSDVTHMSMYTIFLSFYHGNGCSIIFIAQ
jgi:hypothetical protein